MKAGETEKTTKVASVLKRIKNKCSSGTYKGKSGAYMTYEASGDLLALEAANPKKYLAEIQMTANFLISVQKPYGGWNYYSVPKKGVTPKPDPFKGDVSISQYVILGLWAAQRAKAEVPPKVWDDVAQWHLKVQSGNGGFRYHPGSATAKDNVARVTMTAAGSGSLGVLKYILFGSGSIKPTTVDPGINGLSKDTDKGGKSGVRTGKMLTKEPALNSAIEKTLIWLGKNHTSRVQHVGVDKSWPAYYQYSLERVGAIQQLNQIAGQDWYPEGEAWFLKTQQKDGHWEFHGHPSENTCFGILFLVRATQKLLRTPEGVAGGFELGGRDFPKDLSKIRFDSNGRIILDKKPLGELDTLLTRLENSISGIELEKAQEEIIRRIKIEDPEKLIGKRKELLKLVKSRQDDIRQTAIWALSRCARLEDAKVFVDALSDVNLGVASEARIALCRLSRKPSGLGAKDAPYEGGGGITFQGGESKVSDCMAKRHHCSLDRVVFEESPV